MLDRSHHRGITANVEKIGTGLFVGTGATLSTVGPAPLFMSFVIMSGVIWAVMNALAEMTTYLPVQGASAPFYVNHFFEPSLAFAAGDYTICLMICISAELGIDIFRVELLVRLFDARCG